MFSFNFYDKPFQIKLYAAERNQTFISELYSYVYFSGRQNLHPLLITYFLMTVEVAE